MLAARNTKYIRHLKHIYITVQHAKNDISKLTCHLPSSLLQLNQIAVSKIQI